MENENRYIQTYVFFLKLIYLYLFLRQKVIGVFTAGYAGDDVTGSHSLDYREKSVKLDYYADSIGYSLKGTLSYDKAKLDTVSLECGIKKSLSYNDAGLISGIAYSSDKNSSLTTGYEYLYDRNFNITERTHKDTGNKDTFTYDSLNRLISSKLKGKFTNDTYEQFAMYNMNEIDRDIDGMKNEATLNGQFFPADKVTLDEQGKSFVYGFAEEKEIQRIELFKTNLEKNSRIRERDLHIYIKLDEADEWSELTPDCWNYEVDSKNQSIHFNFKETVKASFIKIRTIWDDRDIDNNNVSEYVTFTNESVQKMIRIWTIENSKDEFYRYDKNSNRITLETYTTKNDYAYYKNADNGNTARVMYDGKWWYTYDANGNRTARAMNADHNGNVVNIDKSGEYWEYEWDYHNRLVKIQQYNAPDNAQNAKVEYTYDALNRRIERISRTKTEPEVTQYAYGRNGALAYQKKSVGEKHTERTFVYLNNQIIAFVDEKQNETEKKYFTVTDIQGSITEVYDESQNLVWKSGYTAFGIKAGETTDLIDFDGLYTGCDIDAETGLTYHWNRWRGEDGSNWLSEDPARDGLNWYGYAGQNPTNYIDRNGLKKEKLGEEPHITGSPSPEPQTPELKEKDDNLINQNIEEETEYNVSLLAAEYNGKKFTLYFVINGKKKTVKASLKKQAELEEKFGYDNILCYITTGLNMYISDGGVDESFIDNKLGEIIKRNLDSVNEIKDFNNYSMDLANELGMNQYYAFVYDQTKNGEQLIFNSRKDFYDSKYKYGVGRYYKKGQKWSEKCDKHFELFRNTPFMDIINPGKDNDEGPYNLHDIWPVQLCWIPGKRPEGTK